MKLITLAAALALLGDVTEATQCKKVTNSLWLCGRILNLSPWSLQYTTNPSLSKGSRPHRCIFRKFEGQNNVLTWCTQQSLAGDKAAGCGRCKTQGVDVDGFTYNARDFIYNGKDYTKGVWVQFDSATTVTCYNSQGRPNCIGTV